MGLEFAPICDFIRYIAWYVSRFISNKHVETCGDFLALDICIFVHVKASPQGR
jgi:hypothetical protein